MYRSRPAAEEVEVKVDPTKLRFDPSAIAKYKAKGPGTLPAPPPPSPSFPSV